MSMSAVFHVMMAARPSTSSWSASRWQRIQDAPHVALEVDEVGRALELALHDGLARHRGAGGRSTQEHLREGVRPRGAVGLRTGPPDAAPRTLRARHWA